MDFDKLEDREGLFGSFRVLFDINRCLINVGWIK